MKKEKEVLKEFEFLSTTSRGKLPTDVAVVNPKNLILQIARPLVEKLQIQDWQYVLLALNRKTKIIALKRCDVEECGSRSFKPLSKLCSAKAVILRGFVKFFEYEIGATKFKPTLHGDVLLLEPVSN